MIDGQSGTAVEQRVKDLRVEVTNFLPHQLLQNDTQNQDAWIVVLRSFSTVLALASHMVLLKKK